MLQLQKSSIMSGNLDSRISFGTKFSKYERLPKISLLTNSLFEFHGIRSSYLFENCYML